MRRPARLAALSLALCLVAQPVWAGAHKAEGGEKADKPAKPGTNVEMPILVAPIVIDGKLTAYAYVSSTIVASSSAAAIEIRSKVPFIQDAFVRHVNTDPMGKGPAAHKIDRDALKARLLADARHVVGAEKVVAIQFTQVQVSPLRPGNP